MAIPIKNWAGTFLTLAIVLALGPVFNQAALACPDGAFESLVHKRQGHLVIGQTRLQQAAQEIENRIVDDLANSSPSPSKAHLALIAKHMISYARAYEIAPEPWKLWEHERPMGVQPLVEQVNFAPYTAKEIEWLSKNFYSSPQSTATQTKKAEKRKGLLDSKLARARVKEAEQRRREENEKLGKASGEPGDSSLDLLRKAILRPIELDAELIELLRQERKSGAAIDERHFEQLSAAFLGKCFELYESGLFSEPFFNLADRRAFAPTLQRAVQYWAEARGIAHRNEEGVIVFEPDTKPKSHPVSRLAARLARRGQRVEFDSIGGVQFGAGVTVQGSRTSIALPLHYFVSNGKDPSVSRAAVAAVDLNHATGQGGSTPFTGFYFSGKPEHQKYFEIPIAASTLPNRTYSFGGRGRILEKTKDPRAREMAASQVLQGLDRAMGRDSLLATYPRYTQDVIHNWLESFSKARSSGEPWELTAKRYQKGKEVVWQITDPTAPHQTIFLDLSIEPGASGLKAIRLVSDGENPFKYVTPLHESVFNELTNLGNSLNDATIRSPQFQEALVRALQEIDRKEGIVAGLAERHVHAFEAISDAARAYLRSPSQQKFETLVTSMKSVKGPEMDRRTLRNAGVRTEDRDPPQGGTPVPKPLGYLAKEWEQVQTKKTSQSGQNRKQILDRIGSDAVRFHANSLGIQAANKGPDNVGYDVLLQTKDGKKLELEIKTVVAGSEEFRLSNREIEFARANPDTWALAVAEVAKDGSTTLYFFRDFPLGGPLPSGMKRPFLLRDVVATHPPVSLPSLLLPAP